MALPGQKPRWHLVEKPRAPFRCDVCGEEIPPERASTFTTLPRMYYETPPAGYEPCNRGYDPLAAQFDAPDAALTDGAHPRTGARFVFERDEAAVLAYEVAVYLPDAVLLRTRLSWNERGEAELAPPLASAWATDEALKLARVLHRSPTRTLSRWRG
jgi:hypothetical protein